MKRKRLAAKCSLLDTKTVGGLSNQFFLITFRDVTFDAEMHVALRRNVNFHTKRRPVKNPAGCIHIHDIYQERSDSPCRFATKGRSLTSPRLFCPFRPQLPLERFEASAWTGRPRRCYSGSTVPTSSLASPHASAIQSRTCINMRK